MTAAEAQDQLENVDDGLGDIEFATGPWSLEDAPADAEFIDFGPLRLPAIPTMKVRVEIDPKVKKVGAVSVLVNGCSVQLQVLAARAGKSLWPAVRRTLHRRLQRSPGHQQVVEGHFGPELIANITVRTGTSILTQDVPMRFLGVDGDKWMLRAVVTGPTVLAEETIDRVNRLLTHIAVERGNDARAEGEVLELSPPPGEVDFDKLPPKQDKIQEIEDAQQ